MTDPGLIVIEGQGALTVNDISLTLPGGGPHVAWTTLDLSPLWGFPELRQGSTTVPGKAGRQPNPRHVDETTYQLEMAITGAVDPNGDAATDPVQGLKDNLDYLWDNVLDPAIGTTVTAELELPDTTVLTAAVQAQIVVSELAGSYDKPAVLFLTVHGGRFESAGS